MQAKEYIEIEFDGKLYSSRSRRRKMIIEKDPFDLFPAWNLGPQYLITLGGIKENSNIKSTYLKEASLKRLLSSLQESAKKMPLQKNFFVHYHEGHLIFKAYYHQDINHLAPPSFKQELKMLGRRGGRSTCPEAVLSESDMQILIAELEELLYPLQTKESTLLDKLGVS